MTRKLPLRDPLGKELRRSRAQIRVGFGAKCASCGEERPEALIENSDPLTCVACMREANGQSDHDGHHVAGKANDDLIVLLPVNDHRSILTPAMYDWPRETRENPEHAPLLVVAGRIRGFCDMHAYLMEKILLPSAELLEALHSLLTKTCGGKYWLKPSPIRKRASK